MSYHTGTVLIMITVHIVSIAYCTVHTVIHGLVALSRFRITMMKWWVTGTYWCKKMIPSIEIPLFIIILPCDMMVWLHWAMMAISNSIAYYYGCCTSYHVIWWYDCIKPWWPYPTLPHIIMDACIEPWLASYHVIWWYDCIEPWWPYPTLPHIIMDACIEPWLASYHVIWWYDCIKPWWPYPTLPHIIMDAGHLTMWYDGMIALSHDGHIQHYRILLWMLALSHDWHLTM
jgi:hypothetical protein